MYFLLIRPQQKKIKEHKNMVDNLRRGDQVLTQGGILGKITKVKEGEEIEVELAKDVKVSIIRSTIVNVLSKTEPAKK
jgi:preprotein translocase subunit YajC